jgi:hypothetical protein
VARAAALCALGSLCALGALVVPGGILAQGVPLPDGLPARDDARVLAAETETLSGRLEVVHWPGGDALARRTVEAISARAALPGLPDSVPARAVFYLAPNEETWDFLTGGEVPEWGAGVAIPSLGIAVIPLFAASEGPGERERTAVHEWAHLGLHEYLAGLQIPRWFDEGYAQRAAGGWDFERAWRLRLALATGAAPPFDSLALAWPRGSTEAELAYLLAGSAVDYLAEDSGDRGLGVLLSRAREEGSFEAAFRGTYGLTTDGFESRWIAHVRRRYGWVLVLTQAAVFWVFASFALFAAWRWRARRSRVKHAALRATEPPTAPAYWEGPPTPPIGGFR